MKLENTDTTISKPELFNIIENISQPAFQLFLHYHNATLSKFRKTVSDHVEGLHKIYREEIAQMEVQIREEFSERLSEWEIEREKQCSIIENLNNKINVAQ